MFKFNRICSEWIRDSSLDFNDTPYIATVTNMYKHNKYGCKWCEKVLKGAENKC